MGRIFNIIAPSVLLIITSCCNRTHNSDNIVDDNEVIKGQSDSDSVISTTTIEQSPIHPPHTGIVQGASSSVSSTRSNKSLDNDNMRGFDPASENDMDDNGMRRYMENDDEEGWN